MSKDNTEVKKQPQMLRYSDTELEFLNNTFAEQYHLLVLIRKFLLQGELTENEKNLFENFNPDLLKILGKTYYPELDLTTPIGQLVDLWSNIDTKNKDVDGAWLEMAARQVLVNYVKGRFQAISEGKFDSEPRLKDLEYNSRKSREENFINMSARNSIIQHIDFQTGQLWILAGQKRESIQDIQKRLFRNSGK